MARFVSREKNSFLGKFNSLDLFTKLFIVTLILLAISTPFVVYNYQLYSTHAETQAERLQTIKQLQYSQNNLQNTFARSSTTFSFPTEKAETSAANPDKGFNLLGTIYNIFARITNIFK